MFCVPHALTCCSYLCSENVDNYEHFGDTNKGRCALHDNVEDVHEQAVKKAADEAMAKVRSENPGLSDADLMVQVSDCVKQAEARRRGRAADRLNDFPYEMHGDQLAHRFGFPGVPPPRAAEGQPPRYVNPFHDFDHPPLPCLPEDRPHHRIYGEDDEDERDLGGPRRDDYDLDDPFPFQPPARDPPFHPQWRLHPPENYVPDPRSRLFRHPFFDVYFDPYRACFYDFHSRTLQDALTGRRIPLPLRVLDRFHRHDPNIFR